MGTRVILSIALIPTSHINCRLPRPLRAHTTHFLTNKHHLRPPSTQHSSLPILSSTHPLIPETEHSTMDSPRGSHLDNGKSPTPPVGFRPQNGGIIKVQPPRRGRSPRLVWIDDQFPRFLHRFPRCYSMLCLL